MGIFSVASRTLLALDLVHRIGSRIQTACGKVQPLDAHAFEDCRYSSARPSKTELAYGMAWVRLLHIGALYLIIFYVFLY